jgi:Fic family protein
MCDRANAESNWNAVETAAFLLWRLNWIHPFGGGNGRTSRAVSYLALCIRLNMKLPGKLTIPEQLVTDRARYQAALEDADAAWKVNALDVSKMRELLNDLLRKQLAYLGGPSPSDH